MMDGKITLKILTYVHIYKDQLLIHLDCQQRTLISKNNRLLEFLAHSYVASTFIILLALDIIDNNNYHSLTPVL